MTLASNWSSPLIFHCYHHQSPPGRQSMIFLEPITPLPINHKTLQGEKQRGGMTFTSYYYIPRVNNFWKLESTRHFQNRKSVVVLKLNGTTISISYRTHRRFRSSPSLRSQSTSVSLFSKVNLHFTFRFCLCFCMLLTVWSLMFLYV